MPKKLFLLGGHDLEMQEIVKLLQNQKCRQIDSSIEEMPDCAYVDKNLSWGAKLSEYRDVLQRFGDRNDIIIYGIELNEDITPPSNYAAIDHHNERADRPSSLEQVAELFGVKLDRWQRLVAANDKGYIPEMKKMCATDEEIEAIREADRKAQGVSEKEEKIAKSESQNLEYKDGYVLVRTTLKKFSPLVDRIQKDYPKKLLVINPDTKEITFYGNKNGIEKLIEHFKTAIEEKSVYYGGNPLSFFGFTRDFFDRHSWEETIETIDRILKPPYSYHIFIFPFRIDQECKDIETEKWKHRPMKLDSPQNYNEYTYFYNFVRPVIFDLESDKGKHYFEYFEEKGTYEINIAGKNYTLEMDGIALRHYDNGVGMVSFHMINKSYGRFDDILKINDFGRRIYPQFLGDHFTAETKGAFLPCRLTLKLEGEEEWAETFENYDDPASLEKIAERKGHYHIPVFIEKLLKEAYGKDALKYISPIIDDRMYTICHLMDNEKSKELTHYCVCEKKYAYEESKDWYRYIFVDGGDAMCQNREMLPKLIAESTYTRWSDYGTLFGITRYSFMILSDRSDFNTDIINLHLRTVYYQMTTLALAYRAMILNFSHLVTEAIDSTDKVQNLQKVYLKFSNSIYFREITAQEQGIELFDLARKQMRLDRYLRELDHDINELNGFKQMKLDREINDQGITLNRLAAIFLPPSLLAGIFGMNIVDFTQNAFSMTLGAGLIILSAILGYFIVNPEADEEESKNEESNEKKYNREGNKKKRINELPALLLLLLFAFALTCMPTNEAQKADKNTSSEKGTLCQIIK